MPIASSRPFRILLLGGLLLAMFCVSTERAIAQSAPIAPGWSWAQLRAMPGADSAHVSWLEANVPMPEATELFAQIGRLSKPEAAQLLPSLAMLEGVVSSASVRAFVDSLGARPPGGAAGVVRVAYLLARTRNAILSNTRTTYAASFGDRTFALPAAPAAKPQPGAAVQLSLDFAPAETLLAIVSTPDIGYEQALARISTPAFDALVGHHSQAFYPVALSREQLALNLAHAASTQPLDMLYMYARPNGFYHFADVRLNAPRYRSMFAELQRHAGDIAAYATAALSPYLPPGTRLDRRVSFYFDDLSDGWGSGTIAAVPLEYYKDDWLRMFNTMVHETFHAAQASVQAASTRPSRVLTSAADSALAQAMRTVQMEGTANFIAPALARSAESADSMSRVGSQLLAELASMRRGAWSRPRAQEILNHGVASGGPFYWLGAAMARSLVERDGPAAIGRAIQSDGLGFARTYLVRKPATASALLAPEVAEWVGALAPERS